MGSIRAPSRQHQTHNKGKKGWVQTLGALFSSKTSTATIASRKGDRGGRRKARELVKRRQLGGKIADSESDHGSDRDTDLNDQPVSDDESLELPQPGEEPMSIGEAPKVNPYRGWKFHGLGKWSHVDDEEQKAIANDNTDPLNNRQYKITIRHTDGTEYEFEFRGNTLEECNPFFRAARSGLWGDPDKPTVLDDDVNIFRLYMLAMSRKRAFQGTIDYAVALSHGHPTVDGDVSLQVRQHRIQAFEYLIGTYLLADQFGDIQTANFVIDQITRFSKEANLTPQVGAINQAYDSTLESNPLRMLLRDIFVHQASANAVEQAARGGAHPEFLADLVVENSKLKFDNMGGTIKKWYAQSIAGKPDGHYHQELLEPTARESGVKLRGSFRLLRIVPPTEEPDQEPQGGEAGKTNPSDISDMWLRGMPDRWHQVMPATQRLVELFLTPSPDDVAA